MRVTSLLPLATALLAVVALATTPNPTRDDAAVSEGSHWDGGHLVPRNSTPTAADVDTPNDLSNTTSTTNSGGDATAASNKVIADIRMGTDKVYIGTLRKQRLYDYIYDCLKQLCPADNGVVKCNEQHPFDGVSCEIPHAIVYATNGEYQTKDSTLHIQFRAVNHTPKLVGLDLATYATVAGIYKTMSERPENCFQVDINGSRKTTLCNVSSQVLVAFPAPVGFTTGVQTLFIANLYYNRKSDAGKLNCDASVKAAGEWFNNNAKKQLAGAAGVDVKDVYPRVNCVSDLGLAPGTWWDFKDLPN